MKFDLLLSKFIFGIVLFQTFWDYNETVVMESIFHRIGGVQLSYSYKSVLTTSRIHCVCTCHQENQTACVAVSYTNITRTCELSDRWIDVPTVQAHEDITWDIYFDRGKQFLYLYTSVEYSLLYG